MIVVAVFMVFLILIMGSCAYIAYRAKQKAHAIEEAYKQNDVNKLAHELGVKVGSDNSDAAGSTQPASPPNSVSPATTEAAPAAMPTAAPAPVVPAAATGDQQKDWALKYERTEGGPEADLVVRTGDINNLGFGWPQGFDPFSGNSTPSHGYPWSPRPDEPDATDRIMLGSAVDPTEALRDIRRYNSYGSDGYSGILSDCEMLPPDQACKQRQESMPQPVRLLVGKLPSKIDAVLIQLFVDDFQAAVFHSHFQVSLNGTRIPSFEYSINSLNQTGPIGKLVSMRLLREYWPLLAFGEVKLLIDDPTTKMRDGYAIDFARILVNPHKFKYEVSLDATVIDADKHTPIPGASVTAGLQSASTDVRGKCQLSGLPAGLVTATGAASGYDENSVPVDLIAGQTGIAEIQLHRHEEGTAALERSIEQTGSATIYGIHFDTDSAKLRPDSMPALNAVLGLINNHSGSRWIIAGHTDNQGSEEHNRPLSEKRAASVITWLKAHGIEQERLAPQGFGATRPVADNATASGRALNRRVEIWLAK
jgi:outer membrane protein OmpA-like peptidoglycan-associated protein